MIYASNHEQGATCHLPQICAGIPGDNVGMQVLKMVWALKSAQEQKKLSEKQETYLLHTYQVGEQTGQKVDPCVFFQDNEEGMAL